MLVSLTVLMAFGAKYLEFFAFFALFVVAVEMILFAFKVK